MEHVLKGLALYDRDKHRSHAMTYGGHDPAVCGKGQGALMLWLLGYPDQAARQARDGIGLAETLTHVPSVVHAAVGRGRISVTARSTRGSRLC